jgi:SecD/SecF fusion protein
VSSRRSHLTLVGLIVLALVGVGFLLVPSSPAHRAVKQGLDLQGGLEYVLKAQPPPGHQLTSEDLDRSVSIMRDRVDKLGVSEPIITKQGTDQISIQLAGVHNVNQAATIIGSTAQLELYDLEPALVAPSTSTQGPVATRSLYQLLSRVPQSAQTGKPSGYVLFKPFGKGKNKAFVRAAGPTGTLHRAPNGNAGVLDPHQGKVPTGWKVLKVPHDTVLITCTKKSAVLCPGDQGVPPAGQSDWYLFKHGAYPNDRYGPYPNMKGTDLKLSGTRADIDPQQGPIVLMEFTKHGNKLFHQVTKNEAVRGSIVGRKQSFAIVLDGAIRSFPTIDYSQYPQGIDPTGSGAQITGLANFKEAQNLALVLQTGALPVNFVPLERTDVSATLGKDSLKQARNAAIAGLILVALFLLVLYRFLGLVAVIGLAIYGAFMYAAIVLLGVTMTLPGFAGLILTIGVAADANVVVFERIKEEFRAGKSVRAALAAGYAKGFRTILDANAVTAITALILFAVATAGVKGFALMLLIGTVVSLVTAVAATRAMLGLLAGFSWFQNPRFMGASGG